MARLFLLTTLTMVAFAANSLLNRAALVDDTTGPAAFAALRLFSGALVLAVLVALRQGLPRLSGRKRIIGAGSLALYMLGFSFAYVALDAGLGALVLFGMVQLTMFAGAVATGEQPPAARWIGSGLALLGLAWLIWPTNTEAPNLPAVLLMVSAGFGWGLYSLVGRGARDPMSETAGNFICAAPISLVLWIMLPDGLSPTGVMLAILSGALTSGLGYALWYHVLPRLDASVAALAQLTVPVIAVAGGVLFLSEQLTFRIAFASIIILGGVAFGIMGQRRIGSKGS